MDKRVKSLLRYINDCGYECYIVGGYVRDFLLGIPSNDYDLCSNATPLILFKLLKDYQIISCHYGTISLKMEELLIEITTYRRELIYCQRRPIKYEYINSLKEDLLRRDFTINTLCLDQNEQVIDLLDGLSDLKKRVLKAVGSAETKMIEDPLRILRALRISATLNFTIDVALYNSMYNNRLLLRGLSYERKKQEIDKIIKIKRLDVLIPFAKELDLNLDNFEYFSDPFWTWIMIDSNDYYHKKRSEKRLIKKVRWLMCASFTNYNLYQAGKEAVCIVSSLTHTKLMERYDNLPIKKRQDIMIDRAVLKSKINHNMLGAIYRDLEKKILNGDIKNNCYDIRLYLNSQNHNLN